MPPSFTQVISTDGMWGESAAWKIKWTHIWILTLASFNHIYCMRSLVVCVSALVWVPITGMFCCTISSICSPVSAHANHQVVFLFKPIFPYNTPSVNIYPLEPLPQPLIHCRTTKNILQLCHLPFVTTICLWILPEHCGTDKMVCSSPIQSTWKNIKYHLWFARYLD